MGSAMTQAEAKMRTLAEWRTWVGHRQLLDSHTSADASAFVGEIEQNQPDEAWLRHSTIFTANNPPL
jgi:hypothetical protein